MTRKTTRTNRGRASAKAHRKAMATRVATATVARRYDAAKIDRLTADWIFGPLSANEEIRGGLKVVRDRARELERNDPTARQYLAMCERNIVGRGFQLRVIKDESGIAQKFMAWMDSADITRAMGGPDLQRLIVRSVARDGEVLVRYMRGPGYADGLALHVLEADYLDHDAQGTSPTVVMGVQIDDATGRPVAYKMFSRHPGDTGAGMAARSEMMPASDLLHAYRRERPGQVRAVSWMASVMGSIRMLHGYQEAELVAARVASCKMGFYKIPPGEDFSADGEDASGAPLTDAAPGVFERMPTGWEFQQFSPDHPTTQYGTFVKDIKRDIAGGLNVAYNNLANDLEGVSYSSIRSGTIEEREGWITLQDWFAACVMRPIYREWLKMASAAGTITAEEATLYSAADKWTGRRWPWVDPQNDIAAKKQEIELGLTAPSELAAEMAKDYAAVQHQISMDDEARKSAGLPPINEKKA